MDVILLLSFMGPEIIIIMLAVLLLFGGRKIPELMRGLGRGIKEFNDARSTVTKNLNEGMNEEPQKVSEKEEIKIKN